MKASKCFMMSAALAAVMLAAGAAFACGEGGEFRTDCGATVLKVWDNGVGKDGANVTATLFGDGTLLISGTGAMMDFEPALDVCPPWLPCMSPEPTVSYVDDITRILIQEGVTHIGSNTFFACRNLTSIFIPPSVTSIGKSVLYDSDIPPNVMISGTVPPAIAASAFGGDVVVYVPDVSEEDYRSADVWKEFDIRPLSPSLLEPTSTAISSTKHVTAAAKATQFVTLRGRTLNVNAGAGSQVRIRVMTLTGRTATSFNTSGGAKLSLAKIPSGAYLIEAKRAVDGRKTTTSVVLR